VSTRPHPVSSEIELRLIVVDGPDRHVRAELTYSHTDPYAVRVGFHTGSGETVEWTFARSLLTDGVRQPAGDGDVKVWPAAGGQQLVCLSLSSPSGRALFETPLPGLVEFLAQTYERVPTGCESDFVDVDAAFAELLGG
jgi:hypothetical protein